MTNDKNHDPFSPKKSYDPEAYGPSGVCTPARPNNEIACPRNLADRPFEDPYELQQKQLPAGPGFYIVPYSMTAREMYDDLFDNLPNSALGKFSDLNPHLDGFIKAGTMIILSDQPDNFCTPEEQHLMAAAQEVKAALDPLTAEEADFLYRNHFSIEQVVTGSSTWIGVSSAMVGQHLTKIETTLIDIQKLHQETFLKYGHLNADEFFEKRRKLLSQLDELLMKSTKLRGMTSIGDHHKLKKALGINTKHLVRHWKQAGAPRQIPGYATHIKQISRAGKYMKNGGLLAVGLGAIASELEIQEVCNASPDSAACSKIKYTSRGKLVGSTIGATVGGARLGVASSKVCIAIATASGGSGGLVCLIIAAVGTGLGSYYGGEIGADAGEFLGGKIYEERHP